MIHELRRMTWAEVAALARERLVAVLPVGAVEAHGPHLALSTDGVIAEAMARQGAELLTTHALDPLLLPALEYTAAPFAAGFPGTLSLRPETVTELLVDLGGSLVTAGIGILAIANSHLDPTHLRSLHAAVTRLEQDGPLRVAFPDLTRRRWASRLGEEFLSGACHAGRYEGSVVLAERPELVRGEIARRLPAVPVSLSDAIRAGRSRFEEIGGDQAYFGDPAAATAEEGRETVRVLGAILAEAVLERLGVSGFPGGGA